MFRNIFVLSMSCLALLGCKANVLEIDLSEKDLRSAASGDTEMVSFEAKFSTFGELDDAQKAQVSALETILEKYIALDDFELATTDMGFEVIIEGEIPLTSNPNENSAYYLLVSPSTVMADYTLVQFHTGGDFDKMATEMQAINFMLAPDAYHPTTFKLKADALNIIATAVEKDGDSHLLWQGNIDGRERFKFAGGVYDNIGAGLYFK